MISKFAVPALWKYVVRHSITNCRCGALPVVVVKIPSLAPSVSRSPWYGISERSKPLIGSSKQPEEAPPFDVRSCRLPFDPTFALVYALP